MGEFCRLRVAEGRSRKRQIGELPELITQTRQYGDELVKATKGLHPDN